MTTQWCGAEFFADRSNQSAQLQRGLERRGRGRIDGDDDVHDDAARSHGEVNPLARPAGYRLAPSRCFSPLPPRHLLPPNRIDPFAGANLCNP